MRALSLAVLGLVLVAGCVGQPAPESRAATASPPAPLAPVEAETSAAIPLSARLDGMPAVSAARHLPVPSATTGIGPGSLIASVVPDFETVGCTANFLWRSGDKTYLGAAGHCFMPVGKNATHGPGADYDASGVRVVVCVDACELGHWTSSLLGVGTFVELGPVVYARQHGNGSDYANDFGLVEIPAEHLGLVRAALPVWGGPTSSLESFAPTVCFYGNAAAFGETFPTKARVGVGAGRHEEGYWYASTPGFFGDSGSAVVTCTQDADGVHGRHPVGILTHGVPGLVFGPTVTRVQELAAEAGLAIELLHA